MCDSASKLPHLAARHHDAHSYLPDLDTPLSKSLSPCACGEPSGRIINTVCWTDELQSDNSLQSTVSELHSLPTFSSISLQYLSSRNQQTCHNHPLIRKNAIHSPHVHHHGLQYVECWSWLISSLQIYLSLAAAVLVFALPVPVAQSLQGREVLLLVSTLVANSTTSPLNFFPASRSQFCCSWSWGKSRAHLCAIWLPVDPPLRVYRHIYLQKFGQWLSHSDSTFDIIWLYLCAHSLQYHIPYHLRHFAFAAVSLLFTHLDSRRRQHASFL